MARWNDAGQLDATFGEKGIVLLPAEYLARAEHTPADGQILVVGRRGLLEEKTRGIVARYSSDGKPDHSFGDSAVVEWIGNQPNSFNTSTIQPDGKIVLGGVATAADGRACLAVVRLHGETGAPDKSFGTDGSVLLPLGDANSQAHAVALQLDGKILVGGYLKKAARLKMVVLRLEHSGQLDQLYGEKGIAVVDDEVDGSIECMRLLPDGNLLILGETTRGATPLFALVRLTNQGTIDKSFGGEGTGHAELPKAIRIVPDDLAAPIRLFHALESTADGKILVTGRIESRTWMATLARYNADGTLDASFGDAGVLQKGLFPHEDIMGPVAVQSDGKVVLCGELSRRSPAVAGLVRLRPEPLGQSLDLADAGSLVPVLNKAWMASTMRENRPALAAVAQQAGLMAVVFPNRQLVQFKDLRDGREDTSWTVPDFLAAEIAVSNDGTRLALVDAAGAIEVWDVRDRKKIASLAAGDDARKAPCFSPNSQQLAFYTEPSDRIGLWRYDSATTPEWFQQSAREHCDVLAFSPDGKLLATNSGRLVKLWEVNTGTLLHSFSRHTRHVTAIAFSPDGRTMATGGDDTSINLWHLPTQELLLSLRDQQTPVKKLLFRGDANELISIGELPNRWSETHCWCGADPKAVLPSANAFQK